jgi:hypothetical protein
MLIDQAIERLEDCVAAGDAGPFDLEEIKEILALLRHAPAYDIGGVHKLLSHLKDKGNFQCFMQDVEQHPGTTQSMYEMGKLIWLEGIEGTSYGFLVRFVPQEQQTDMFFIDVAKGGIVMCVCSDSDMIWREKKTGRPISDKVRDLITVLITTAYLASNPKCEVITIQEGREETRNKRGTKVLRPKRKRVRTIIIDGVERIKANGVVSYRVHPRGWHVRRHKVAEHLRHLATGTVITVRAHERGDAALGFVPWFKGTFYFQQQPKHYKVQPDQTFFTPEPSSTAPRR